MKTITTILAAAALAVAVLPAQASSVCLKVTNIDHTDVVDPQTVLFHMRDGTTWKNTLVNTCPSLKYNGNGFVMNSRGSDVVCSNKQTINVLHGGQTCMLGEFTHYSPPSKAM